MLFALKNGDRIGIIKKIHDCFRFIGTMGLSVSELSKKKFNPLIYGILIIGYRHLENFEPPPFILEIDVWTDKTNAGYYRYRERTSSLSS